ncbi:MAG: DPP IV N-terminal domain-containing protein, partial [Bryobacteraceae bacterium]|nr:DPP IV N-terminal domain-containing protein [Bryobacteraceae bacterium]
MTPTGTGENQAQEPRLESWKAISQFLGRSVTTVQRWEAEEGFPVHRLPHKKRASVYAYPSEIERWMKLREAVDVADPAPVLPSPLPLHRRKPLMWIPVAAALCGAYLIPHLWPRPVRQARTPTMVPVTSYAGIEQHPHFSPDGGQVVFVWERDNREYDLYLKDYPDGRPRQITNTKEREGSPRWSPDGRSIVFARYEAAPTRRIFVMDLEKKTERQVATIAHARRQAIYSEWTPDSSALLISDRPSPDLPFRVERMALDTSLTRTPLTNPPPRIFGDIYGVISPDGRSLAFARCVREEGGCDIFVQQLPAGVPRKLTSVSSPVWGLCWLPDSKRLVYSSGRGGRFQLWETGIDGLDSGLKLLGDHVGVAMHPAVRPGQPSAEP